MKPTNSMMLYLLAALAMIVAAVSLSLGAWRGFAMGGLFCLFSSIWGTGRLIIDELKREERR